jgi:hypothetical protein
MTTRTATCSCGQLRLACTGEPVRLSICHCLECQKRTGSVFATQARFPRDGVTIEGRSTSWSRRGDAGSEAVFHFCPVCGATVWWETTGEIPQTVAVAVAVAVGAFADPTFPPPRVAVYEERAHPWTAAIGALAMARSF